MSLAALQHEFVAFLKGDGPDVAGVRPTAERGLAVYHYAYRAALIAALRDTFERSHAWLGDSAFDEAARAHIAAVPPKSWTMSDFGLGFDATLDRLYPDDAEVAELAWLDWSMRRAFDGPDAPDLDRASLADVDWDAARFVLVPTLAMRTIVTNAPALWNALAEPGETPPAAQRLDAPAAVAVWRDGLQPRFQSIAMAEHDAIMMAHRGETFGAICRSLVSMAHDEADVATMAGDMLGRWIAGGLLTAIA